MLTALLNWFKLKESNVCTTIQENHYCPNIYTVHQGHNTLHEKLNEQKKTANFQSLTLTYCFALYLTLFQLGFVM